MEGNRINVHGPMEREKIKIGYGMGEYSDKIVDRMAPLARRKQRRKRGSSAFYMYILTNFYCRQIFYSRIS